jgi:hypothetical protein
MNTVYDKTGQSHLMFDGTNLDTLNCLKVHVLANSVKNFINGFNRYCGKDPKSCIVDEWS